MRDYLFGTGFEMGRVPTDPGNSAGGLYVDFYGDQHSGAYSLMLMQNGMLRFPLPNRQPLFVPPNKYLNDLYVGIWLRDRSEWSSLEIRGYYSDIPENRYLAFCTGADGLWKAYRNTTLLAAGATGPAAGYRHLTFHFHAATDGGMAMRINGADNISYVGDTVNSSGTPATNRIRFLDIRCDGMINVDDLVVCANDWPEDVRFERLTLTGDVQTDWAVTAGSAAGTHYGTVNDARPTLDKSIYTETDGQRDLFAVAGWAGQPDTRFLNVWYLLQNEDAGRLQASFPILMNGHNLDDLPRDINSWQAYYQHMVQFDPTVGIYRYVTPGNLAGLQVGLDAHRRI